MENKHLLLFIMLLFITNTFGEISPIKSLGKTDDPILVSSTNNRANKIILNFQIPDPIFKNVSDQKINNEETCIAKISNLPNLLIPGEPIIPKIPTRVILPYGKTIDHIEIIPKLKDEIKISSRITYSETEQPISTTSRIYTPCNIDIYESNDQYPSALNGTVEIQKAFGISIAKIDLYPLVYFPKTKTTKFYSELSLIIHLKDQLTSNDIRIDVERFLKRGKITEENEDALYSYPTEKARQETYNYVLITSESIVNNTSIDPNVNDLIDLRTSQGFSCKLMTTEEIESNYSGESSKDKIRNFIKYAYNNWNTEFVTLGGDINIIDYYEFKTQQGYNYKDVCTDIPFQCLDEENWSSDFEAEVYVGRMPAETAEEFSNQLHKIIQYETEPNTSDILKTSLGLGCNLDWNNSGMKSIEYLLKEVFPNTWQHDSLYDATTPSGTWPQEDLINKLATNKYGNVDHDGHGSADGTMRFDVGETDKLINTKYPFLYSLACIAGKFSVDCIAEHFISEHRTGGFFGGILNSEVGLYSLQSSIEGSSPTIHRSFWNGFWEQDMEYFSQCNAYSHQMNTDRRFTCLTTNYFGDAATRFRGKDWQLTDVNYNNKAIKQNSKNTISAVSVTSNKLFFSTNSKSSISLNIYSLNGKRIFVIPVKVYSKGIHSISFNNNYLAKGLYIVKLISNQHSTSVKLSFK